MNDLAMADLGRKITSRMQDDLQREVSIAQHVLNPHEITILMMKVAAGLVGASCLVALQIRRPDSDPSEVFDAFADGIQKLAIDLKPEYLSALASIESARKTAA